VATTKAFQAEKADNIAQEKRDKEEKKAQAVRERER
jgi:hypothetical protein